MIDQFRLDEKIGFNRHYEVYKAMDKTSGKTVVVKRTRDNDPLCDELLKKEYRLLSQIDSPRVVKALSLIEENSNSLILEYLSYNSLRDMIERGALEFSEKLAIALELFKALDVVHSQGILHLDINPSNISWKSDEGRAVLFDFNAAQQVSYLEWEFKGFRKLLGTPEYIAPEQTGRTNRLVDYRADYYSAGVTLYELFTGRLPFNHSDPVKLIYDHISTVPESPSQIQEDIPTKISLIIMKLMAKDQSERYQSVSGVCRDLESVMESDEEDLLWVPGRQDYSGNLNLSQKLFGRERELSRLASSFQLACGGEGAVTFIGGYSGVGKTALVKELSQYVNQTDGVFLTGKYEQFNRNLPYSAIYSVLDSYLMRLMSREEEQVLEVRHLLLENLGDSAGVLIQWHEGLSRLLGNVKKPETLRGQEAVNRFNHAVESLFRLISTARQPLVIFLDDVQWIDTASVVLIQSILEKGHIPFS